LFRKTFLKSSLQSIIGATDSFRSSPALASSKGTSVIVAFVMGGVAADCALGYGLLILIAQWRRHRGKLAPILPYY
jgi:hypothetical protein